MVWSRQGGEVYAATDDQVVGLRVSDGRRRLLLADPGLSCSGDFNCTTFFHALSSDGRFLVVEAEGGRLDGRRLFALATDGSERVRLRLPYPRVDFFSVYVR
jgi:hypothetical protein